MAREQTAKEEHEALEMKYLTQQAQWQLETQRQQDAAKAAREAREAERRKASEVDRIAQKEQLKAVETQRAAQFKADETIRIAQHEYNLKIAAALYHLSLSTPSYVAKTPNDLIHYYCLNDQQDITNVQLNNILSMLYQGLPLPAADLRFLKSNNNPQLYKLAIGLLTYESYIAGIKAAELALKQAEARRLEREAAVEAERIAHIKRAEEQRLQREKDAEAARIAHLKRIEEQRLKREAEEAARIARESDPAYILRRKYGFTDNIEQGSLLRLMGILQSIDTANRMADEDFVWLNTKAKRLFSAELREAYHLREAEFCANEYRRTQGPWNVINASAHYRKGKQPESALKLLESVPAKRVKHPKINSAMCTTLGGAMRDLKRHNEALQLGKQAHELQPQNFRPCTLLGALNIELGNFSEGHDWYTKAEERGAKQQSIDTELKSIFNANKSLRETMKAFLLADDPIRYSWVNDKKYQND